MIENFEPGTNSLRKEGVVSPEDAEKAVHAHQEALNEIETSAQQALESAGGNYDDAIEEATANGQTELAEKLQVMKNVSLN